MTKQFKKIETNTKCRGMLPFEFADGKKSSVEIPDMIHVIPIGEWSHDVYGPIKIDKTDIREFVQNFNQGIRKGVFITAGHEGWEEQPAVGWITKVEAHDDGLWGEVEWNEFGKGVLTDKQWKFFSPELVRDYEDPQDHQIYRNVLTGGALTKSPYFKELQAIVFSDRNLKTNFNETTMNLKELLAKDITTLSDDEKAFIKANVAELTEEEKISHSAIIDEPAAEETEEEKTAREAKEAEEKAAADKAEADKKAADDAAAAAAEGADKGEQQMSEKVTIKASELALLRDKADKGAQAFAELEKRELDTMASTLIFNEVSNKAGRFLPKSKDNLRAFMESLNKAQRVTFSSIIAELPKANSFSEIGGETTVDGTVQAEVESKIAAKMTANKSMKYSDALKEVMSENEGLEKRYDEELPVVRGAK